MLKPARPGSITLARHGEPALSRKCMLTSDQYRDWWAKYELGGLLAGQTPPISPAEPSTTPPASARRLNRSREQQVGQCTGCF